MQHKLTIVVKPAAVLLLASLPALMQGHDPISTKVTWTREVSRLMFKRCTSCHREGGSAFALTTYDQARPWAKAIRDEVLARRMPPFGAVKGFGELSDDQALTQEQIETLSDWVEGGAPEGDPKLLPENPDLAPAASARRETGAEVVITGSETLKRAGTFEGIKPKNLKEGCSTRVIAIEPNGVVVPLVWIYDYRKSFERSWYFRKGLNLPAGTKIISSSPDAGSVALLESPGGVIAAAKVTSTQKQAR